ncbi:hypothetical protein ACRAQ7_04040 [Erythrobacter sp. W53]|uniref:hypothetical protein n=1 Tax=Erythrobacter sp. W53 TaxID=3425947 RepID=UPI003D766E84
MLKLYKFTDGQKLYWETWESEPGISLVHWGELGTKGETKTVTSSLFRSAHKTIQKEIDQLVEDGFAPVELEDYPILMIEYAVDGMGNEQDIAKRHRLEDRMNETLGCTGLGMCDGGSIGSGTMEVCTFVVDYDVARRVVEGDLQNTEFSDFVRIYEEV